MPLLFWMPIILWSAMCKVANDDTRALLKAITPSANDRAG